MIIKTEDKEQARHVDTCDVHIAMVGRTVPVTRVMWEECPKCKVYVIDKK